jgi:glycosyltransferase involved in cell wall biosynthesis
VSTVHLVVPEGVDDPGRPSGGNTYDRMLARGLAQRGWEVRSHEVAAPQGRGGGRYPAPDLAAALSALPSGEAVVVDGLVGSDRPDVLVGEAGRLRVVVLVHLPLGLDGPDREVAAVRSREREVLGAVSAVVTTSRWARSWLLDAYDLDPERVAVGVPGAEPARAVAGLPDGRRLLCVGAVVPAKGHDVLVEALARVAVGGWTLECVGSLERDPLFVDRLCRAVQHLGLAGRVRFCGALVGAALDDAYARADLLVTASRVETYGMVVTEALARGIPVLATRVGGLPEALGRTTGGRRPGILVPVDDPSATAGSLEQWLGDPAMREHLREAARERRRGMRRPRTTTRRRPARRARRPGAASASGTDRAGPEGSRRPTPPWPCRPRRCSR